MAQDIHPCSEGQESSPSARVMGRSEEKGEQLHHCCQTPEHFAFHLTERRSQRSATGPFSPPLCWGKRPCAAFLHCGSHARALSNSLAPGIILTLYHKFD